MKCPGSIRLTKDIPHQDTKYTIEGTSAHTLAQMALERKLPALTWLGMALNDVEITEEMAEAVQVYVDDVNERTAEDPDTLRFIEQRFDLSPLNPPGPMFGTGDVTLYQPNLRLLRVHDLKYGSGVLVEVIGNEQLCYYAVGALLELRKIVPEPQVDIIELTICQPRAHHKDGITRRWRITRDELRAFAKELLDRARATLAEDAPLVAGRHCRFCPAAATCPAQYQQAQAIAQVEFADLPANVPPSPEQMPEDLLQDVMQNAHILEEWLRSVRQYVQGRLEAGGAFPGWKLVAKRATRKWISEEATYQWAERQGVTRDEITELKLLSPARVEKACRELKVEVPGDLWEKKSSGYVLAPDYDVRPPILAGPDADFESLPPGSVNETGKADQQEEA